MHYYQHNIKDFRSGTIHMPRLMRWLYRDMLECYYDREKPLPADPDEVSDLIGAFDAAERDLVPRILKMKFKLTEAGWAHERCDEVLAAYLETQEDDDARKENEAERQRRHREARKELFRVLREEFDIVPPYDTKTNELRTLIEQRKSQASHGPVTRDSIVTNSVRPADATAITNNHKPLTNNQEPELTNPCPAAAAPGVLVERRADVVEAICEQAPAEVVAQKMAAPRTDAGEQARQVFAYWQKARGHERAKLDDKRMKAIKERLKNGYTVEDLCRAVDGVSLSAHHMGRNEAQTVYDDIELICRTAANVDKFMRLAGPSPAAVMPERRRGGQEDIFDRNAAEVNRILMEEGFDAPS